MKRKLKKAVTILCIILILFGGAPAIKPVYAEESGYTINTVGEAGAYLAQWAKDFANTYGNKVAYCCNCSNWETNRANAYLDITDTTTGMYMDCVGWVSYAIHHALGLGDNAKGFTVFVSPKNKAHAPYFDDIVKTGGNWSKIKDEVQPGDILYNSHHVMIYVGNNQMVDCSAGEHDFNAVQIRNVDSYVNKNISRNDMVGYARINDTGVSDIGTLTPISIEGTSVYGEYGGEMSDFYFNGVPDGKYSVAQTNIWSTIVNFLSEIVDYLIGIATYLIRIVIVGWTALIDKLITNTVNGLMGVDSDNSDSDVSNVTINSVNSTNRMTLENLVFNLYAPLDVNIFKTVDEDEVEDE